MKGLVTYVLRLTCLFISLNIWSQNLVRNPSFEAYDTCPKKLGNFSSDVMYWSTPTIGSTDYFNSCSTAMGTPKNFNGTQLADFGKGYAGLYLYAPEDYREYIQAELSTPLVAGETYRISFYVSLAERSDYAVKEFGVLLSNKKLELSIKKELSKMQLYKGGNGVFTFMEIGYTNFYRDTKDWILVNTQFQAKGGEKYLVIGNFNSNARTRKFKTKRDAKQGAYYYIDMVALTTDETSAKTQTPVTDTSPIQNPTFSLNTTHTFKNVLFDFDKSQLLGTAKIELEKIYKYLMTDASLIIRISGHTDNRGSDYYNETLSASRCNAVARYLIQKGLPKDRISWKGYGSSMPVATNDTEAGRQLNRRVEFVISKEEVDHN